MILHETLSPHVRPFYSNISWNCPVHVNLGRLFFVISILHFVLCPTSHTSLSLALIKRHLCFVSFLENFPPVDIPVMPVFTCAWLKPENILPPRKIFDPEPFSTLHPLRGKVSDDQTLLPSKILTQNGNISSQNQLKLYLKSSTWNSSTRSWQALTLPDTWLGCLLLWEVWSTNHENRTFRWTLTSPITSSQLGQNEPTASKRLYYGLTAYWLIMADSHLISHQIKILLDDSVFPQPPTTSRATDS